jgi:hypothetical protein
LPLLALLACSGNSSLVDNALDQDATSPVAPPTTCGSGTFLFGNECVALAVDASSTPSVTCGPGTLLSGDTCLVAIPEAGPPPDGGKADAAVACGPGTYDDGGVCLLSLPSVECGPGTSDQSGICVALGDTGGEGGDQAAYEVRAPSTVAADGFSPVPILALGPVIADGGVGIVLGLAPPLGALLNTQLSLGALGASTYYVPCSSADPSCTGDVRVTMALASAPAQVVALSPPMALVAPTGVGDPSPCLTGGSVLFFDGDATDFIHPGIETISMGAFQATAGTFAVHVNVSSTAQSAGTTWSLDFSTQQLNQPIAAQVYTGAQSAPFAAAGHPGIEIGGDGRGCNTIAGSFQIETLQASGTTLQSFTATFEQHCEAGTSALRGCIHVGP